MKKNYVLEVIELFFKGKYADDTNKKVQQWLIDEKYKNEKEDALYKLWEDTDNSVNHETLRVLNEVKATLGIDKNKKNQSRIIPIKLLKIVSVIVSVLLLTGSVYFFYYWENTIEYTALNGEIRKIDLPDGSKVWLNAGSIISYKKNDKNRNRTVKLSGEAFFIVEPDSLKPFVVETGIITTEVLGTEFNIESYPDNPKTTATLNAGKIKVYLSGDKKDFYFLAPDQQFVYNPSSGIEIQPVYADEIKSWKDGNLVFYDASLTDIIHKLERHFNLRITVQNLNNYSDYYTIKFVDGENIGQIMDILEITIGNFSYEIEGI